jgi:hypothetical protein
MLSVLVGSLKLSVLRTAVVAEEFGLLANFEVFLGIFVLKRLFAIFTIKYQFF